jgi:hypothetical protein
MASKDLLGAVDRLVEVATGVPDDRALRGAVNAVVNAFDGRDAKAAKTAIVKLGKGLATADGRAIQVLYLTLGALVEAGAPPEAAWKVVGGGVTDVLERATRFARACLEQAGGATEIEAAFAAVAAKVAAERPRDAAAWRELSARCLACVACLARARKLRKTVASDAALLRALEPLTDAVDEVGLLAELLEVLDGETVLILHPSTRRGVRAVISDVASNVELVVLAAGALDARTRARAPKAKTLKTKLDPIAWTSLRADGSSPAPHGDHDHDSLLEGRPSDIPLFGDTRAVILRDLPRARALPTEAAIPGLVPEVRVVKTLATADVTALLAEMAKARAPQRPRKRAPKRR